MDDILGRIVDYFISIFSMFLLPICLLGLMQIRISQVYVMDQTAVFVNSCCLRGYISKEMYDDYLQTLNKTGLNYQVNLTIKRKNYEPDYQKGEDGKLYFTGNILTYPEDIFEDSYLLYLLNKQGIIYLQEEDYFKTTVQNLTETAGSRILRSFSPALGRSLLYVEYGGGL